MNIKRFIFILIGLVLIGFSVGLYSLIYNDEFKLSNINFGNIDVRSNGSDVKIGSDGIEVKDGDDHVIIDWNGINVTDGDEHVLIGPDGIDINGIDTNNDWSWNIGNWFSFGPKNLKESSVNEEKFNDIDGIESIKISSSFIDIKFTAEDRDDVRAKYYGRMKSNVVPVLETERNGSELIIKLVTPNLSSYTVTESNVVLEVFVPEELLADYSISTSSASIYSKNIISKNLQISSSSGDINLTNIDSSDIKLSSSSGDIIGKGIIGNVNVSSSSGDVTFNLDETTNIYNINTSSGDVNIEYNGFSSYRGVVDTSSGDIEYDGSIKITNVKDHHYEFIIGPGDKNITINTSSGDIELIER